MVHPYSWPVTLMCHSHNPNNIDMNLVKEYNEISNCIKELQDKEIIGDYQTMNIDVYKKQLSKRNLNIDILNKMNILIKNLQIQFVKPSLGMSIKNIFNCISNIPFLPSCLKIVPLLEMFQNEINSYIYPKYKSGVAQFFKYLEKNWLNDIPNE